MLSALPLYMSRRIAANRVPSDYVDGSLVNTSQLRAISSGASYPFRERFLLSATAQS
jgi:hypothetical protein